jgi:hypothetical protein
VADLQIYRYLPDIYRTQDGTALKSLLASISETDSNLITDSQEARKELFLTTATGKYLLELASQYGFTVPRQSGFNTEGLRKIAIPAIFLPKQILTTFNAIAEAFYVRDVLHPSFQSPIPEPYALADGDDISFETEVGTTTIVFRASLVSNIASVTAGELAGIINSQQNIVFADVVFDRALNANVLKISGSGYGSNAKLRVYSGITQNVLKFPLIKNAHGATGTQWSITKTNNKTYDNLVTFTWTGIGSDPLVYNLDYGDLVTIKNLTGDLILLNGSFRVVEIGVNYFTFANLDWGTGLSLPYSYTQSLADDIVFTSGDFRDLYTNLSYAVIAETKIGKIDVYVPVLPPVIKRSLVGSVHFHGAVSPVLGLTRNSVYVSKDTKFPDSGTFVLQNPKYNQNWLDRYFRYTGKIEWPSYYELLLTNNGALLPVVNDPLVGFGYANPVYATLDSNEYKAIMPVVHGFQTGQEFGINGFSFPSVAFEGGLVVGDFNTSHQVKRFDDLYSFYFELNKPYGGCQIDNVDVKLLATQVKGCTIALKFADVAVRIQAGFENGMRVKIPTSGTVLNVNAASTLWNKHLAVVFQENEYIYLNGASVFTSVDQTIVSAASVLRSARLGGTTYRHYLVDPYSGTNWNSQWFDKTYAVLVGSIQEANVNYVSAYMYDTIGDKFPFVVSALSATMVSSVRKYEAPGSLLVTEPVGWDLQGQLYIDYGNDNLEGPIEYVFYEKADAVNWRILINKSYQFTKDHIKAVVRMARSTRKITLNGDGRELPVYITGVVSARAVMESVMKSVAATGVQLNVIPLKPDLKYQAEALDPFQ